YIVSRILLVARRPRIAMVFVQLRKVERQRRARPWIMTAQTLRATVEMPGLPAMARWRLRVGDLVCAIGAHGVHERGVGLIVVPLIRVAAPVHALEMENLRLDAAAALRFVWFHFQRQRLRQNCV